MRMLYNVLLIFCVVNILCIIINLAGTKSCSWPVHMHMHMHSHTHMHAHACTHTQHTHTHTHTWMHMHAHTHTTHTHTHAHTHTHTHTHTHHTHKHMCSVHKITVFNSKHFEVYWTLAYGLYWWWELSDIERVDLEILRPQHIGPWQTINIYILLLTLLF